MVFPAYYAVAAILCVLPSESLYAQFRWGVAAGVNFASIEYDHTYIIENQMYLGAVAGLRAEYKFLPSFAAYFWPQYAFKGSDYRVDPQAPSADYGLFPGDYVRERYEFLELPAGLIWEPPWGGIRPYAFAGTAFALNTAAAASVQRAGASPAERKVDWRYKTEDFDILMHGGIGVDLPVSNGASIIMELSYSRSFRSLYEWGYEKVQTSDFRLIAGLRIYE